VTTPQRSGGAKGIRARYAGSPSGDIHIGNMRTLLFNWFFARHEGGTFVWRVEDTDPERAKPELIARAAETFRWIGIDWDEGPEVGGPHEPYRQSQRGAMHREALAKLEASGMVYRCYCTRDDIKARGVATGYDRFCRTRTDRPDAPYALRFVVPEEDVVVHDLLRGEVRTPFAEMQDFVVARSDGSPTFVVANTADDIDMEITHVIRATDLLPAAAQNVLLFRALGAEVPVYAHVPLVLGPDKARLGARHGAVGTLAYRDAGYLPEALMNYLALLGWGSPSGDEILDRDRIVSEFTLDRIHHAPAVFDTTKLNWLNQQYIQQLAPDDLVQRVMALYPMTDGTTLAKVVELELIQTRITTLAEIPEAIRYLHERPMIDEGAAGKWLGTDEARTTLETVASRLESLEPWEPEAIKTAVQSTIEELDLHRRKGPKPIFVAIAGQETALPLFESIWLIGREEAVARLRAAASV
jgi:glutamyl-tRNA synthetase